MKVSVWDTYVTRNDGALMHFDILVPIDVNDENIVYSYGKAYLEDKAFKTGELTSKECRFCHIEEASDAIKHQIGEKGFYIIEMENCN